MDKKEIELDDTVIYRGKILDLHKYKVLCPNGIESFREVVHPHASAACVIAKIDDKFVLVNQYRFCYRACLLEFPAGKSDEGEKLEDTAVRELEEEIGYHANSVTFLGEMFPTVGFIDESISIFYATDLVKTKTHFDEDELITIKLCTQKELDDLIANNIIKDAKTIVGYHWYKEKII